jgi:hypothetical protein
MRLLTAYSDRLLTHGLYSRSSLYNLSTHCTENNASSIVPSVSAATETCLYILNVQNYWVSRLCPSSGKYGKSRNPVILSVVHHRQNRSDTKRCLPLTEFTHCTTPAFSHHVTTASKFLPNLNNSCSKKIWPLVDASCNQQPSV